MVGAGLDVVIGFVYFAAAATVLRQIRGSLWLFPWLPVLAAFFVVRGVDRITTPLSERPLVADYVADGLVGAILVLLLLGLRATIADLKASYEAADARQQEYGRALADYQRLARHRLANPLAAIRGGLAALRELDDLSPGERDRLLRMLEQQARRLEHLSLDPSHLEPEERPLRPVPENLHALNHD